MLELGMLIKIVTNAQTIVETFAEGYAELRAVSSETDKVRLDDLYQHMLERSNKVADDLRNIKPDAV